MKSTEKKVKYTTTNTYATLNQLNHKTKNVWLVFHGISYLSRFFLRYFDGLNPEENYIIAPQAPSKYYLKDEYKHVGASWLTKENTPQEIKNNLSYVQSVLQTENIPQHLNFIILGFSQGVSMATRYINAAKPLCHKLIIYAGSIPHELKPDDLTYLIENKTEITCIVGNQDEYLTPERMRIEDEKINELFKGKAKKIIFDGGHEIKKDIINNLV